MFEAAIFDWDGTLADTRIPIVVSFHRSLTENGLDISTEYIERRIGIGASDTFREILRSQGRAVDETLVKRLVTRKSEIQVELADEVKLFPGATELLAGLQGKLYVALASMNNRTVIGHLLKVKGIEECFEYVMTGDRVAHSKPDPEIFLKTAEALRVAPERSVVFEDSIFGVKAAKAAGMSCIAVTTGVYSAEELQKEKPDLIVETLNSPEIARFIHAPN
jgi:haloacid dehalogenase superfamily, subfamily IA, variant 3 with third motif having DD or ED/haloacid dehalogenase superfamily, subfamily IA, variant 1 with third motif having Dx(3-4)D or Dx(3-4)E